MIGTYVTILSYLSMLRYWAFADAWDLGGFVQAVYTATRGLPLVYTLNPFFYKGFPDSLAFSFLGTHFSPVLYLLVPLYAVVQRPETLLFVQSLVIGLGGIPVYKLAKRFHGEAVGLAFLGAYLVYPGNIGLNLDNFHPEAFIPAFMLFALYFFISRRFVLGTVFSALTAMVIEEGAVLILALVAFMVLYQKAWRKRKELAFYSALAGGSLIYLLLAFEARTFYGLDPTGFTLALNSGNYQILGASFAWDVPLAVLRSPGNVLPALAFDGLTKLSWLLVLLAPVALLPLLFPEGFLVLGLPWLAVAFLSNYRGYYSIYGIQQSFFIFCIFPCAVYGLRRLHFDSADLKRTAFLVLACSLIVGAAFDFNPANYGSSFAVSDHARQIDRMVSLVPQGASVLTTSNIYPHLANRLEIYTVPPSEMREGYQQIDAQILGSVSPAYILVDYKSPSGNVIEESNAILSKAQAENYSVLAYADNVILFQRGYTGEPVIDVIPGTFNATNLRYYPQVAVLNSTILRYSGGSHVPAVWFGPYVFLPQGNYTLDILLKFDVPPPSGVSLLTLDVTANQATTTLASRDIRASDVTGFWQVFSLSFTLAQPLYDVQFRGMYPSANVSLQGITLVGSP
jgi:uncharacterized membrane protein